MKYVLLLCGIAGENTKVNFVLVSGKKNCRWTMSISKARFTNVIKDLWPQQGVEFSRAKDLIKW